MLVDVTYGYLFNFICFIVFCLLGCLPYSSFKLLILKHTYYSHYVTDRVHFKKSMRVILTVAYFSLALSSDNSTETKKASDKTGATLSLLSKTANEMFHFTSKPNLKSAGIVHSNSAVKK